jgi:hypothetical protein
VSDHVDETEASAGPTFRHPFSKHGKELDKINMRALIADIFRGRHKFGISKNTIVGAYERLVADGHVVPKAGSGFIVVYGGDSENGARPKHVTEAVDIGSCPSEWCSWVHSHRCFPVGSGCL